MGPRTDKNTTKGERKMIIKIEIDEARSAKIVEWLGSKYDKLWKAVDDDLDYTQRMVAASEYETARDALASAGIRMTYDRHTKRPIGIEAM